MKPNVTAAGILLLVCAALILMLDLWMGMAVGGIGLSFMAASQGQTETWALVLLAMAALVQIVVLVCSLMGAGVIGLAGVRAIQGETRSLRAGAALAVVVPTMWLLTSLLNCAAALTWTLPLVLGLIALGLAHEAVPATETSRKW